MDPFEQSGSDDSFAEVWNKTEITVASPNEQIFVTILGRVDITVRFAPGYYERADADQLRKQLVEVTRAGVRGYVAAYWRLRSERVGHHVERRREPLTTQDAVYQRGFEELYAEGSSADGLLSCGMIGMREYTVTFQPSVLGRLDAVAFERAAGEAATAMLQDQLAKAARLRDPDNMVEP